MRAVTAIDIRGTIIRLRVTDQIVESGWKRITFDGYDSTGKIRVNRRCHSCIKSGVTHRNDLSGTIEPETRVARDRGRPNYGATHIVRWTFLRALADAADTMYRSELVEHG